MAELDKKALEAALGPADAFLHRTLLLLYGHRNYPVQATYDLAKAFELAIAAYLKHASHTTSSAGLREGDGAHAIAPEGDAAEKAVAKAPEGVTPHAWSEVVRSLLKEVERTYGPGPVLYAVRARLASPPRSDAVAEALRELLALLHKERRDPRSPCCWYVQPGKHLAFSACITRLHSLTGESENGR